MSFRQFAEDGKDIWLGLGVKIVGFVMGLRVGVGVGLVKIVAK